jgi:crossover junction endodeoxyribonuclease RuvC
VIVLGIDPGLKGALAWIEGTRVVALEDMPTFQVMRGGKPRDTIDVHGLARLMGQHAAEVCWFEQVGGMQGDGPAAAFQFGRAAGAAEAIAKASGCRFETVTPPVWKKAMGLIGTAKDQSRAKATSLFPAVAGDLARKMDDGRAEALLLAEYGRRKMHEMGVFG